MDIREKYGYNEDRDYDDGLLKKKIEELEGKLKLSEESFEDLSKAQLIQKISIIEEIIKYYRSLESISDDEKDYGYKEDEYIAYEQELQEYLDNYDGKKHNETEDAKSWNEYREEESEER